MCRYRRGMKGLLSGVCIQPIVWAVSPFHHRLHGERVGSCEVQRRESDDARVDERKASRRANLLAISRPSLAVLPDTKSMLLNRAADLREDVIRVRSDQA